MSLLNSVLKAFVGDKSKKDVKELQPLVEQIKSFGEAMKSLSHDELRAKTASFKAAIAEACVGLTKEIEELKNEVNASADIDKNEELYCPD